MKITEKDQLRMKDRVTLSWQESEAKGPVIEVHRRNGAVCHVRLAGHPEPFLLVHEAVTAKEWGQKVWTFEGGERPVLVPEFGQTGTATVRGFRGMRVMRTDGTGGADAFWVTPNIVGGSRTHFLEAVTDFQPDPNYAAAVDSYARRLDNVRRGVVSMYPDDGRRQSLLMIIDDGATS